MSDTQLDTRFIALPLPSGAPVQTHVPPASGERRRPGRIENASPELIALMRKPNGAARIKVALYDAPGFLLPAEPRRPAADGRSVRRMAVALTACSGFCVAAFHVMFVVWG